MPRERVLILDDEIDVLELCQRLLEREGYQVHIASDGWEGIQKARQHHYELLLTDVKMPGMTGLEAAQSIKALQPDIVCITMTGYSSMNMAIDALRLGIDEFIVKPFTPEELIGSISKALERVRLRRENIRLQALIPLFELSKVFLSSFRETDILEQVGRIAQAETHAHGSLLLLTDSRTGQIIGRHAAGILNNVSLGQHGGWQVPWMIISRPQHIMTISDTTSDPHLLAQLQSAGAGALIGHAIMVQEQCLGALIVAREPGAPDFGPSDAELLAILSGQAGIAIANARLFEQVEHAYEELKKLDHMKSEFINIAAHELRTPLAILMGYVSILDDEIREATTRERLGIIMRNAVRLRSIIDDMLDVRNLERGQITFLPNEVQVGEVIHTVVTDLAPLAREKRLEVEIHAPSDLPMIYTDRHKLESILTNLLSNAIKFTPANGHVLVSAEADAKNMTIHVADTGVGIPPEALQHIFDAFYQVEESLTREHGGIGLGLTITKGMVKLCGGQIMVQSTVGQGSRFSFTLPLKNKAGA